MKYLTHTLLLFGCCASMSLHAITAPVPVALHRMSPAASETSASAMHTLLPVQFNAAFLPTDAVGVTLTITCYRTGTHTDISVTVESISFTSDFGLDVYTTPALFDMVSLAAIGQALAQGQLTCPGGIGGGAADVRVIVPACVVRNGKGVNTHFKACDESNQCIRQFTVSCPLGLGAPEILPAGAPISTGGACNGDGGCEPTCPAQL